MSSIHKILVGLTVIITLISLPLLAPYILIDTFSNQISNTPSRSSFESWELESWWGMQMESPPELEPMYRGLFETQATERSGIAEWRWNNGYNKLTISWAGTSLLIIDPEEQFRDGWEQISRRQNVSDLIITESGKSNIDERSWDFQAATIKINGVTVHVIIALAFYQETGMAYSLTYFDTAQNILERMAEWSSTFRIERA